MSYAKSDDCMQMFVKSQLPVLIRRRRSELGLSQQQLADLINCVSGTVQNWESGKTMPDAVALAMLNQILGEKFANDFLAFSGMCGAKISGAKSTPPEAMAHLSHGIACLASALADGKIDHMEYPAVFNALAEIVSFASSCQNSLRNRFGAIN